MVEPARLVTTLTKESASAGKNAMQLETIGKYQLHLIAHEAPGRNEWDPFVTVMQFDDEQQDFSCILERTSASDHPYPSYEAAIEVARRVGTAFVESHIRQHTAAPETAKRVQTQPPS